PGVITGALVAIAAGAVAGAVLSLQSAPAATVSERTVSVTRGVISTVVSGSGNLPPAQQGNVDFATSRQITPIHTQEGAHVCKGQLLARVDDRSQRVALAKAEADLSDAQTALTKAQDAEASGQTASVPTVDTQTVAYVAQASPTPAAGGEPGGAETPT